jgi:hypothetical protein
MSVNFKECDDVQSNDTDSTVECEISTHYSAGLLRDTNAMRATCYRRRCAMAVVYGDGA